MRTENFNNVHYHFLVYFYQIIKCLNQIISENKPYNLHLCTFAKFNLKRTRASRSLVWRSAIELTWFLFQFTFKLSSWIVCNYAILITKRTNFTFEEILFLIQIIKCLNQFFCENEPYNLCLCTFILLNFKRKIWNWTGGCKLGPPDL